MIERLFIRNSALLEEATLHFGAGLNILTGETGSGKSVVLSALRLILGERATVEIVGPLADLAIVEADVRLDGVLLQIRREIHRSGKSRCFINDELVALSELRALFEGTIELADQGATYKLFQSDALKTLLDRFGQIDGTAVKESFHRTEELERTVVNLQALASDLRREEPRLRELLELLEATNWQPDEEERLSNTHVQLTQAQVATEKLSELSHFLSDGTYPLLPALKRFSMQMQSLKQGEVAAWLDAARANLEEVSLFLASHLASLEFTPEKLDEIEERISAIEAIKKRVAKTQPEATQVQEAAQAKLTRLDQIEEEIAHLTSQLAESKTNLVRHEEELTRARRAAASQLQTAVLAHLKDLNLPDARLEIHIVAKQSSPSGADEIQWLFSANPGGALKPLHEVASGGEVSRLLLAIKLSIRETKCLILDEIDGNVGGQTATWLGLKLQELAKHTQIICITHFVQVAKCAMHHFLISKRTDGTKTIASAQKIDGSLRDREYNRMTGVLS